MSQEILYLENRKVIKVSGLLCVNFLNNILTSDISKLLPLETRPSALLSPQGRVLFDLLVSLNFEMYSQEKSILIEYDLFCEDELFKKLNMYNLRKEVKVEKTNFNVFVINKIKNIEHSLEDKRFKNLNVNFRRFYDKSNKIKKDGNDGFSFNFYNATRYKYCIVEGAKEIKTNVALPLEINLDLFDGISFEKGCFIGQEVNARIKWKGLVKRKYVPITFKNKNTSYFDLDKIENNKIFLKKEEIGEVIALSLNQDEDTWYGIANIRLSQLYLFEEDKDLQGDYLDFKIKINFPSYMLPLPKKI